MVKVRNINSLVDDQDHTFAGCGIIVRESGRNRAKVTIKRTLRILTSDIDRLIKIVRYQGVRTYCALVGVQI